MNQYQGPGKECAYRDLAFSLDKLLLHIFNLMSLLHRNEREFIVKNLSRKEPDSDVVIFLLENLCIHGVQGQDCGNCRDTTAEQETVFGMLQFGDFLANDILDILWH